MTNEQYDQQYEQFQNQLEKLTAVNRIALRKGFRFEDQDGNVLRKCATRPYTHMAVQMSPAYTRRAVQMDGSTLETQVGAAAFVTFHSTSNPKVSHSCYRIVRVLPITEKEAS